MQLEPPNLDPTGGAAAAIDEVVYANIFEGLTRFGPDGSVQPALAKSWSIEDDGKRYVFALQEGVKFHDGTAFTAEDVKFSLDRAMAEDSTNAQKGLFKNIANVDVIDDATVAINLSNPDGNLLFNLAWGDAVMVASESIENAATTPVGTGPFVFGNWVQGIVSIFAAIRITGGKPSSWKAPPSNLSVIPAPRSLPLWLGMWMPFRFIRRPKTWPSWSG